MNSRSLQRGGLRRRGEAIDQLPAVRRDLTVGRRQIAQRLELVQDLAACSLRRVSTSVSTTTSAASGSSYGSETPVNCCDLAAQRLGVQALGVALDQHVERAAHEDLDEAADLGARLVANGAIGRDGGGDGHATAAADTSLATYAMRRMLVSRSSFEKPRPLLRFSRTSSPSRTSTCRWRSRSAGLQRARERALAGARQPGQPDRETGGRAQSVAMLLVDG